MVTDVCGVVYMVLYMVWAIQWVVMCVVYVGHIVGWGQTRMGWGVSHANDVTLILYNARQ